MVVWGMTPAHLLRGRPGHVHLVGICGIGMAGVAFLLKSRGFMVSGCDTAPSRISEWLTARGIRFFSGHDSGHVEADVEWVIRSAAVPPSLEEIAHARSLRLPVFVRGRVLSALLADTTAVAVCGTHGKTTTAAFITHLLKSAGCGPSWCIGGESGCLGGVAGTGDGGITVVEADESDGTLALYAPDVAVVTNIEFDHMEHFGSREALEDCFRTLAQNTRRTVVFCRDDRRASLICSSVDGALSYGFSAGSRIRGRDVVEGESSASFTVEYDGREQGVVRLPVPGRHNVLNGLAAVAAGKVLGLGFEEIVSGLDDVCLPRRRFEIVRSDGITVVSDYAHHPTEIAALIATARGLSHSRLVGVFQPHRYTRTLVLGEDFPPAFAGLDELVLTPVYAASEKPIAGGTVWDLYGRFRGGCEPAVTPLSASSLDQAWRYLRRGLRTGDVLLVIGAGDVGKIADWAREGGREPGAADADIGEIEEFVVGSTVFRDEPLGGKTTLGVGGSADIWAEVASAKDLAAVLQWAHARDVPLRVLGAGSNVLVSDLGVRGITMRLAGGEFGTIRRDECGLTAGAAVSLSRLLDWLEEEGFEGLEFLEGIPGTVGGAVGMNAGAWNRSLSEHVSRIRCLNSDGTECTVGQSALGFGYRRCSALANRTAVEVCLTVESGDRETVRKRRADFRARRSWMRGLRSAGSVFRNPESGDSAGRLLERAGMKGVAIGGAEISKVHANIIVAGRGAVASDVRALVETARMSVESQFGIRLEPELRFFE